MNFSFTVLTYRKQSILQDLRSLETKFYTYLMHLTSVIQSVTSEGGNSSLDSFLHIFDTMLANDQLSLLPTTKFELEHMRNQIEGQKRIITAFSEKFQSVLKCVLELDNLLGDV